jgi:hypothetical protein
VYSFITTYDNSPVNDGFDRILIIKFFCIITPTKSLYIFFLLVAAYWSDGTHFESTINSA